MASAAPNVLKVNELVTVQGIFSVEGDMELYDTHVAFIDSANRSTGNGALVTYVPWHSIHYWTGPAR